MTEIDADIDCDTFIPDVHTSMFQPWYSSFPVVENKLRFSFITYVQVRNSEVESSDKVDGVMPNNSLDNAKAKVQTFSFLPKMIFEKHEEFMYLKLVEDIFSNGIQKDDRTGTGTLSKFGCQVIQSSLIFAHLFYKVCYYLVHIRKKINYHSCLHDYFFQTDVSVS